MKVQILIATLISTASMAAQATSYDCGSQYNVPVKLKVERAERGSAFELAGTFMTPAVTRRPE